MEYSHAGLAAKLTELKVRDTEIQIENERKPQESTKSQLLVAMV
jgi:hypothetical protein